MRIEALRDQPRFSLLVDTWGGRAPSLAAGVDSPHFRERWLRRAAAQGIRYFADDLSQDIIRVLQSTFQLRNPMTSATPVTHDQLEQLSQQIKIQSQPFRRLMAEVGKTIVGQEILVHRMLVGLLANGHLLIEGVPGLAKTTAVACLAKGIQTGFQRLQFTPDLLPADLIGTLIYRPQDQKFVVQKGPIFSNIILADEINRAPAKVQSALLEAMQERQVTIGGETFLLDEPFLVMATQN